MPPSRRRAGTAPDALLDLFTSPLRRISVDVLFPWFALDPPILMLGSAACTRLPARGITGGGRARRCQTARGKEAVALATAAERAVPQTPVAFGFVTSLRRLCWLGCTSEGSNAPGCMSVPVA